MKVPDSWNEVSVGQYQELCQATRQYEVISILLDQDQDEVRKMDSESFGRILSHIGWVKNLPSEKKYNAFVTIDDVEYKLIENLREFSLGEWYDMEEYITDFKKNTHNILAMLYRDRPGYDTVECRRRAELFKEKMMIGEVYGSFVFFSHVVKASSETIPLSLIRQSLQRTNQTKKGLRGWLKRKLSGNGTGMRMRTT